MLRSPAQLSASGSDSATARAALLAGLQSPDPDASAADVFALFSKNMSVMLGEVGDSPQLVAEMLVHLGFAKRGGIFNGAKLRLPCKVACPETSLLRDSISATFINAPLADQLSRRPRWVAALTSKMNDLDLDDDEPLEFDLGGVIVSSSKGEGPLVVDKPLFPLSGLTITSAPPPADASSEASVVASSGSDAPLPSKKLARTEAEDGRYVWQFKPGQGILSSRQIAVGGRATLGGALVFDEVGATKLAKARTLVGPAAPGLWSSPEAEAASETVSRVRFCASKYITVRNIMRNLVSAIQEHIRTLADDDEGAARAASLKRLVYGCTWTAHVAHAVASLFGPPTPRGEDTPSDSIRPEDATAFCVESALTYGYYAENGLGVLAALGFRLACTRSLFPLLSRSDEAKVVANLRGVMIGTRYLAMMVAGNYVAFSSDMISHSFRFNSNYITINTTHITPADPEKNVLESKLVYQFTFQMVKVGINDGATSATDEDAETIEVPTIRVGFGRTTPITAQDPHIACFPGNFLSPSAGTPSDPARREALAFRERLDELASQFAASRPTFGFPAQTLPAHAVKDITAPLLVDTD